MRPHHFLRVLTLPQRNVKEMDKPSKSDGNDSDDVCPVESKTFQTLFQTIVDFPNKPAPLFPKDKWKCHRCLYPNESGYTECQLCTTAKVNKINVGTTPPPTNNDLK